MAAALPAFVAAATLGADSEANDTTIAVRHALLVAGIAALLSRSHVLAAALVIGAPAATASWIVLVDALDVSRGSVAALAAMSGLVPLLLFPLSRARTRRKPRGVTDADPEHESASDALQSARAAEAEHAAASTEARDPVTQQLDRVVHSTRVPTSAVPDESASDPEETPEPSQREAPRASTPYETATHLSELSMLVDDAVSAAEQQKTHFSLLVAEVDSVHAGDAPAGMAPEALAELRDQIRAALPGARLAQPEGSSLVAVLPDLDLLSARVVAERVRLSICHAGLTNTDGTAVTVSIGVSSYPEDGHGGHLVAAARDAMSRALHRGGNRTVISHSPVGTPAGWSAAD